MIASNSRAMQRPADQGEAIAWFFPCSKELGCLRRSRTDRPHNLARDNQRKCLCGLGGRFLSASRSSSVIAFSASVKARCTTGT